MFKILDKLRNYDSKKGEMAMSKFKLGTELDKYAVDSATVADQNVISSNRMKGEYQLGENSHKYPDSDVRIPNSK